MLQKNYVLTSICDKFFVKLSHVKLFLWAKASIGLKQRHPILAQLLVSYNGIWRIEKYFCGPLTTFCTVFSGKSVFHLNQLHFRKWAQL